jgi:hypothetical protein
MLMDGLAYIFDWWRARLYPRLVEGSAYILDR